MRHPGVFYFGGLYDAFANKSIASEEIVCPPRIRLDRTDALADGSESLQSFPNAAEIRGHTTVTMWRNALNDLQGRHPLLNVFIGIAQNSRPVFYQAAHASPALAG